VAPLQLPLWFVTLRNKQQRAADHPVGTFAFTSTDRLIAFLAAGRAGPWKIHTAGDSQELILVVADLHSSGVSAVCVNPELNGEGGRHANLAEVMDIDAMAS
jgi:hypothetical protein